MRYSCRGVLLQCQKVFGHWCAQGGREIWSELQVEKLMEGKSEWCKKDYLVTAQVFCLVQVDIAHLKSYSLSEFVERWESKVQVDCVYLLFGYE